MIIDYKIYYEITNNKNCLNNHSKWCIVYVIVQYTYLYIPISKVKTHFAFNAALY